MGELKQAPALPDVTGLLPAQIAALLPGERGDPSPTHARAIWRWLRDTGIPAEWPATLPSAGKAALTELRRHAQLPGVSVDRRMDSRDGTVKWRLRCRGMPVETVLIPHGNRSTVCVSSQSGCTRSCDFCATASLGFRGQLTAGEMVAQVLLARVHAPVQSPVKSVVFMGMGEPLDNLDEVVKAVDVLEHGVSLGPTHVTVSTSGVLPGMEEFVQRSRSCLALSLHATTDELRARLMPGTRKWKIAELVDLMRRTSGRGRRHYFIEYLLLRDINDSLEDAHRLAELLKDVRCAINLIPFNAIDRERGFQPPDEDRVRQFQHVLLDRRLVCVVRQPRGADAAAACGQLACLDQAPDAA